MTRRKGSAVLGIFTMPQELAVAALGALTPSQREAVSSKMAGDIMQVCVDAAQKIGAIIEPVGQPPVGNTDE